MTRRVPRLLDVPVVAPVPEATLEPAAGAPGALLRAWGDRPEAIGYFVLNVGDGDSQLIVLPPDKDNKRRLVVVDIATNSKLPSLLDSLHEAGVIDKPGSPGQVRLLVATHPHFDHIGGMADFLDTYPDPGFVDEFWEPGYFYPSPSFHELMLRLEGRRGMRWLQPTAGTSLFLDEVSITVMGPGVGLRHRFDTFGVNVNDASLTLMVEYPATKILSEPDPDDSKRVNRRLVERGSTRMLLGADAQFRSWAQTSVDFPNLEQETNEVLARELRAATGPDYLRADVLKLSHHGSKHGVNIELLERVGARATLVSSQIGAGSYNFPHLLALEAVREAGQPTTSSRDDRLPDERLGIHITGGALEDGSALGTIAAVVDKSGRSPVSFFRMMDAPDDSIDLTLARKAKAPSDL